MKMTLWIVAWFLLGSFVANLSGCECIPYHPFEHPDTWTK